MKRKLKNTLCICFVFICILTLGFPKVVSVNAEDSVESLEGKTSTLQNELSGLNSELSGLSSELDNITTQIETTTSAVEQAQTDLADAKANEQMQYEAMKTRIKYMYEEGNTTFLDLLFSSKTMADFLNKADFISTISEYDRNMIEKLYQIQDEIASKEANLKIEQDSLITLKASLDSKQVALNDKIAATSSDFSQYTSQLERAKEAAAAAQAALEKKIAEQQAAAKAKQEAAANTPPASSPNPPTGSSNPPFNANTTDLELMAALLEAESGSSNYEAVLAVGAVVMNRVHHSSYPDTIKGVIYQSGQFSPTWNGSLDRILKKGAAPICYTAAQDAINGKNNIGGCLSFRMVGTSHQGITIGDNVFF